MEGYCGELDLAMDQPIGQSLAELGEKGT